MDYGTVLCVASNVVGRQIVPCIYHVIPAGMTNELKQILEWEFKTVHCSGYQSPVCKS